MELDNENGPAPTSAELNKLLSDWLTYQNATLISRVITPKGESISVDNFIPAGWSVAVVVVAKRAPAAREPGLKLTPPEDLSKYQSKLAVLEREEFGGKLAREFAERKAAELG